MRSSMKTITPCLPVQAFLKPKEAWIYCRVLGDDDKSHGRFWVLLCTSHYLGHLHLISLQLHVRFLWKSFSSPSGLSSLSLDSWCHRHMWGFWVGRLQCVRTNRPPRCRLWVQLWSELSSLHCRSAAKVNNRSKQTQTECYVLQEKVTADSPP